MATLLYRLGLFSAKRAWLVLVAWLLILATSAGLALSLGGKLTTSISIDGVPSQQVIDKLQESFPDAGRASGQVVFHKVDGSFTDADRSAISEALVGAEALSGVSEAIDPFEVQKEITQGQTDLADGKQDIIDAEVVDDEDDKK